MKAKLATCVDTDIAVCSIVKGELYFGAANSKDPAKARAKQDGFLARFVSIPFDDHAADVYGAVRAALTRVGQLIGPNDLLIASIALSHRLCLVTSNVAEFSRVSNLQIENWEEA